MVATNVGAIPEVVESGKTGILVPPKNEIQLAEAIKELLCDNKLRKRVQ